MNIDHPLVGSFVATTEDVTFANGNVIKAGAKGRVQRCELLHDNPPVFIVKIAGLPRTDESGGERAFHESQLRTLERKATK